MRHRVVGMDSEFKLRVTHQIGNCIGLKLNLGNQLSCRYNSALADESFTESPLADLVGQPVFILCRIPLGTLCIAEAVTF